MQQIRIVTPDRVIGPGVLPTDQEIKDGVQDIMRALTAKFRMQPALPAPTMTHTRPDTARLAHDQRKGGG